MRGYTPFTKAGKEWKEGPGCLVPFWPPTPRGLGSQLSPPCSGAGRSHLGTGRTGASTAPRWLPTPAALRSAGHCSLSGSAAQSPTSSHWRHCGRGPGGDWVVGAIHSTAPGWGYPDTPQPSSQGHILSYCGLATRTTGPAGLVPLFSGNIFAPLKGH